MIETKETLNLDIEVTTSQGVMLIPVKLKPLARILGCFEMTIDTVMTIKKAIEPPLDSLLTEVSGLSGIEVEKEVHRRLREATQGSVDEEIYRQLAAHAQAERLAAPNPGGGPPSDNEMAALIDTFLDYPGMDSTCLLALSAAAARRAADKILENNPESVRGMSERIVRPMVTKSLNHLIKVEEPTREMIRLGRAAEEKAEELVRGILDGN